MLFLVIQLFKLYLAFSGLFSGLFFYFNLVSDENSSLNYPTFRIGWPTRVMLTTKPGSQTFRILNKVGCVFQMVRNSIVTHPLYSQLISKVKTRYKASVKWSPYFCNDCLQDIDSQLAGDNIYFFIASKLHIIWNKKYFDDIKNIFRFGLCWILYSKLNYLVYLFFRNRYWNFASQWPKRSQQILASSR